MSVCTRDVSQTSNIADIATVADPGSAADQLRPSKKVKLPGSLAVDRQSREMASAATTGIHALHYLRISAPRVRTNTTPLSRV